MARIPEMTGEEVLLVPAKGSETDTAADGKTLSGARSAKCMCCLPIVRKPPVLRISFQLASFVPWTTWSGQSTSEARIGVRRFSLAMGREWPWFARIKWCAGLSGSARKDEDSVDEDGGGEEIGMRAKRCFSLVCTMDWSSGNVTLRDERRLHDS